MNTSALDKFYNEFKSSFEKLELYKNDIDKNTKIFNNLVKLQKSNNENDAVFKILEKTFGYFTTQNSNNKIETEVNEIKVNDDELKHLNEFNESVDILYKNINNLYSKISSKNIDIEKSDELLIELYEKEKEFIKMELKFILYKCAIIGKNQFESKKLQDDYMSISESLDKQLVEIESKIDKIKEFKSELIKFKTNLYNTVKNQLQELYENKLNYHEQIQFPDLLRTNITDKEKQEIEQKEKELHDIEEKYQTSYARILQIIEKKISEVSIGITAEKMKDKIEEIENYIHGDVFETMINIEKDFINKTWQLNQKKTDLRNKITEYTEKKQELINNFTEEILSFSHLNILEQELNEKDNPSQIKKELQESFKEYQKAITEAQLKVKDIVDASKGLDKLNEAKPQLKGVCEQAKLSMLLIEQQFEQKRIQLYAEQKNHITNQATQVSPDLISLYRQQQQEGVNTVINRLKDIRKELRDYHKSIDKPFQELELWSLTPWGELLINREKQGILDQLGVGFEKTINELKGERRRIKSEFNKNPTDALVQQKNEINLLLYHTILQRLIDVVGEKVKIKNSEETSQNEKKRLEFEIGILNEKYVSLMEKYKSIEIPKKTIFESTAKTLVDVAKSILTLGYFNGRCLTPSELERKKRDADLGCDIKKNVMKWINDLKVDSDTTWKDVIKREIEAFIKWSDKHPRIAINLAGDIALTCAIIGGQDYANQFITTMKAKAYSEAFLQGWKFLPQEEPFENEEERKYRALADLFRFAPLVTAVVKPWIGDLQKSYQEKLVDTGFSVLKALTIQHVQYFIADDYARYMLPLLQAIKGEDFQKILEEQTNIELIKIGGAAKQVLVDPKVLLNELKIGARIWTRTLSKCKGWEKVARITTQIIFPAIGVIATVGLGILTIIGGPVTWLAAAAFIGPTALVGFTSTAKKINDIWNKLFPAYNQVREEMLQEREAELKNKIKGDIAKERREYVSQQQSVGNLPSISSSSVSGLDLGEFQKLSFDNIEKEITESFREKLQDYNKANKPKNAGECVRNFDKICREKVIETIKNHKELKEFIESLKVKGEKQNLIYETMVGRVLDSLMKDWLFPQLDVIFCETALSDRKDEDEKVKGENPIDYLKQVGEEKKWNESLVDYICGKLA